MVTRRWIGRGGDERCETGDVAQLCGTIALLLLKPGDESTRLWQSATRRSRGPVRVGRANEAAGSTHSLPWPLPPSPRSHTCLLRVSCVAAGSSSHRLIRPASVRSERASSSSAVRGGAVLRTRRPTRLTTTPASGAPIAACIRIVARSTIAATASCPRSAWRLLPLQSRLPLQPRPGVPPAHQPRQPHRPSSSPGTTRSWSTRASSPSTRSTSR
jgi:hypothetical protein